MRGALRLVLLLGIAATVGGLFLPWIEIDGSRPLPVLGGILDALGARPASEPVNGLEILRISLQTGDDPLLRTSLAISELVSGRPDRAAARALFGDRYEEDYAWFVLLPAVLALLHLPLLRRSAPTTLRSLFAGIDTGTTVFGFLAAARIQDAAGGMPLKVLAGVPVSLLGLVIAGAALLGSLLPAGNRRR